MTYDNHPYNNHVIEALDDIQGKKIIEWWESCGVNTRGYSGHNCKKDGNTYRYYGLVDGYFDNYSIGLLNKARIITLDEVKPQTNKFKVGDEVSFVDHNNGHIPKFYTNHDGIPDKYISHGNTSFKENRGVVVDFYMDFIIVGYTDLYNKVVQLGFKEENLTIINKSKTQKHGNKVIEVQTVKATVCTGERRTGTGVSGRRINATVAIGHLSNKAIIVP